MKCNFIYNASLLCGLKFKDFKCLVVLVFIVLCNHWIAALQATSLILIVNGIFNSNSQKFERNLQEIKLGTRNLFLYLNFSTFQLHQDKTSKILMGRTASTDMFFLM